MFVSTLMFSFVIVSASGVGQSTLVTVLPPTNLQHCIWKILNPKSYQGLWIIATSIC